MEEYGAGYYSLREVRQLVPLTAKSVRSAYVAEYRYFIRRVEGRDTTYWSKWHKRWEGQQPLIWDRIAAFVEREQIPLLLFLRERFDSCSLTPAYPDDCLTSAGLRKALTDVLHRQLEVVRESLARDLDGTREVETNGLDDEEYLLVALHERQNANPSPLFSHCKCSHEGDHEKAANYEDPAVEQFLEYPDAYSIVWDGVLPKGFSKKALWAFGIEI